MMRLKLMLLLVLLCHARLQAQEKKRDTVVPDISGAVEKRLNALSNYTEKTTLKWLHKIEKEELRLTRKLNTDSLRNKAQAVVAEKYKSLAAKMRKTVPGIAGEYDAYADSLGTALKFLGANSINTNKAQQLLNSSKALETLRSKMAAAEEIQKLVQERQRMLTDQLKNNPLLKQLKGMQQKAFYYEQQVNEYKALLHDRKKAEQKAMAVLRNSKPFKDFMQKHSQLAALFGTPDNYGSIAALAGLQTRANVVNMINDRLGTGNSNNQILNSNNPATNSNNQIPNAAVLPAVVQQQIQDARAQLQQLQSKLKLPGQGGDLTMPDFKPNSQKTKKFLHRFEKGYNFQTHGSNRLLPATTDLGLSLGYKLNDKSVIGIGAAYKVGLGRGWNHIAISSEGVSLRSYADVKLKGNLWISGGYEKNYLQAFKNIHEISDWQASGLIGITKKIKGKGGKEVKLQLLYDFLDNEKVKQGQRVMFRMGWGGK